jgi:hypothetical protein
MTVRAVEIPVHCIQQYGIRHEQRSLLFWGSFADEKVRIAVTDLTSHDGWFLVPHLGSGR